MRGIGLVLISFSIMVLVSGCGKKKASETVTEQVSDAANPAELPELDQNKMYLNNPIVPGEQDTTFEPVPDEQQHLSAEEQSLLGPALD